MCLFSTSGVLLVPKTLQNGKVGPEVKKALWGVLGSKNVPRCLCFSLFGAWGEKHDFSFFANFCDLSLFGRKSCFWRPKVGNRPKRSKSALSRLFAKMAFKIPKKALARATFLAHARFLRFGAQKAKKCVLGRKSAPKRQFSHFWAQNRKNHPFGRKS